MVLCFLGWRGKIGSLFSCIILQNQKIDKSTEGGITCVFKGGRKMSKMSAEICPYCGNEHVDKRCDSCGDMYCDECMKRYEINVSPKGIGGRFFLL